MPIRIPQARATAQLPSTLGQVAEPASNIGADVAQAGEVLFGNALRMEQQNVNREAVNYSIQLQRDLNDFRLQESQRQGDSRLGLIDRGRDFLNQKRGELQQSGVNQARLDKFSEELENQAARWDIRFASDEAKFRQEANIDAIDRGIELAQDNISQGLDPVDQFNILLEQAIGEEGIYFDQDSNFKQDLKENIGDSIFLSTTKRLEGLGSQEVTEWFDNNKEFLEQNTSNKIFGQIEAIVNNNKDDAVVLDAKLELESKSEDNLSTEASLQEALINISSIGNELGLSSEQTTQLETRLRQKESTIKRRNDRVEQEGQETERAALQSIAESDEDDKYEKLTHAINGLTWIEKGSNEYQNWLKIANQETVTTNDTIYKEAVLKATLTPEKVTQDDWKRWAEEIHPKTLMGISGYINSLPAKVSRKLTIYQKFLDKEFFDRVLDGTKISDLSSEEERTKRRDELLDLKIELTDAVKDPNFNFGDFILDNFPEEEKRLRLLESISSFFREFPEATPLGTKGLGFRNTELGFGVALPNDVEEVARPQSTQQERPPLSAFD